VNFTFSADVWEWRGPAPFFFASVPTEVNEPIKEMARAITYGWGAIPVTVTIDEVQWTTSIFPKDGTYIVPLKAAMRAKHNIIKDSLLSLSLQIEG